MKFKKTAAVVLASLMSLGMAVPAMAAGTWSPVIDNNLKGSITLHKIIENTGANMAHDGHVNPAITNTPLDGIGFSYIRVAEYYSVTGDKGGVSTTGLYFTNIDQGIFGTGADSIASKVGVTVQPSTFTNGGQSVTVYTVKALEDAISAIIAAPSSGSQAPGEKLLLDYIAGHGTAFPEKTNALGVASKNQLPLGMYVVGETDISAHDGINPATGLAYDLGIDDQNPESPIVESPAKPFLVTLPFTNVSAVDGNAPGTVWEYDIDVYPKDQTTNITKSILDPDEPAGSATLRSSEDAQIGDIITQVIYADAPALQKSYTLDPGENKDAATVQPAVTHETYKIRDTMTVGLTFKDVLKVVYGPKEKEVFTNEKDFSTEKGFTELVRNTDYTVTAADDRHGFVVELTNVGLSKLDALTADSQVAVVFTSDLNSDAVIGEDTPANSNRSSLTWKNSNTVERTIESNPTTPGYTYELDLTKTGLADPTKAAFTISRKESATESTPIQFVKESDGVYHFYDKGVANANDTNAVGNDKNAASGDILSEVHPSAAGKLVIKGFDSKTYTFMETETQQGYSLLKSTFDITFDEQGDPTVSSDDHVRDGDLTDAVLAVDGMTDSLDIDHEANGGIARMTLENHKAITLRTGGEGRFLIYGIGAASTASLAGAFFAVRRKKRNLCK